MKNLFFFRSSATRNEKNNVVPPPTRDEEVHWEHPSESALDAHLDDKIGSSLHSPKRSFSRSQRRISDGETFSPRPALRRSHSFSSAAFLHEGTGEMHFSGLNYQSRTSSNMDDGVSYPKYDHPSRCRDPTQMREYKKKQMVKLNIQCATALERPGPTASSRTHHKSSRNSSTSSTNVSTKILDRYIDGEQQEKSRLENNFSQGNCIAYGTSTGQLPPRVQYMGPSSPTYGIKNKPRSHSFRDARSSQYHNSSGNWSENGFEFESPRRFAKDVIERLSQSHVLPKTSTSEVDENMPTTFENISSRSLNRCFQSDSDVAAGKCFPTDEPIETFSGCHPDNYSWFQNRSFSARDNSAAFNCNETEAEFDAALQKRRAKEAQDRVMLLSQELEQKSFLPDCEFDERALIQHMRNLTDERINLALEASGLVHSLMAERASAKENLRLTKAELESQIQKLEKEKNELKSGLEKELDRRSSEWSFKLEKYRSEEQKLRQRVRELAEQNVSLQREVSSFNERERESRSMISYSDLKLKDLTTTMDEMREENHNLQKHLSELEGQYRIVKEERECVKRKYEEKEKECKELHKSVTRLLRTCSEQEKTIDGLRERFSVELIKNQPVENYHKLVAKLQMEQMRLTGVELALRRQLECYEVEIDSLRRENANLIYGLKDSGKEGLASTFKLDEEIWTRIHYLQNQGVSLLNESFHLCSTLFELIKEKEGKLPVTMLGMQFVEQYFSESEMKVEGLKSGTESLKRSVEMLCSLLHEKSSPAALKVHSLCMDADASMQLNGQYSEDVIRSELKAETLLTSMLREKLYSKELEVEQLHAELATTVRGNDILRCEIQNAMDNLASTTHKLKDLEFQMLKKDENIDQLENDLQESKKEVENTRGILPKISEDRDMMWQEVKKYSEKNKQLSSEVQVLKKKIEALDEDILLKEGQITILKDTLVNKPFDLLATPGSPGEFLLQY